MSVAPAATANKYGLHHGVPEAEYRAWNAVSQSELKDVLRSPAICKYKRDNPPEPTAVMKLGTAVHCAILQPGRFETDFACEPSVDKRTKAGKELLAVFEEDNAGKTAVSFHDWLLCGDLAKAVHKNQAAADLLYDDEGKAEASALWQDPITGLDCKARFDWLTNGRKANVRGVRGSFIITDLKTCEDASPGGFSRQLWRYGYHIQAAFYLAGYSILHPDESVPEFVIIAVEKKPPHLVAVYRVLDQALMLGQDEYENAMTTYKKSLITGEWPGYSDEIEPLDVPAWAYNRTEGEDHGRETEIKGIGEI